MVLKYDFSKLKGRIIEKFDSCADFGKFIGKDKNYVSRYLNNKSQFTQKTIEVWRDALEINADEIGVYFFSIKSCE